MNSCPNCGSDIKETGFTKYNPILFPQQTKAINEYFSYDKEGYCKKCGTDLIKQMETSLTDRLKEARDYINKHIGLIPIVTIQSPLGWDYNVIGIVTGQSTTGTGLFSEITSTFTDLFGMQSNSYNSKIRDGEKLCLDQLRSKAIRMGGNAVVGVDIDYAELGSVKGMIMVCMTGTAVNLKNLNELNTEINEHISKMANLTKEIPKWEDLYIKVTKQ